MTLREIEERLGHLVDAAEELQADHPEVTDLVLLLNDLGGLQRRIRESRQPHVGIMGPDGLRHLPPGYTYRIRLDVGLVHVTVDFRGRGAEPLGRSVMGPLAGILHGKSAT